MWDNNTAYGLLGFLLGIGWLSLVARLYVRLFVVRKLELDDMFIGAAMASRCFPTP